MLNLLHILAASDDGVGKVIFGVIVFIIWGISALVNMTKKTGKVSPQAQADMERVMREQMAEARRRDQALALQMMDSLPPMAPPLVAPPRGPAVPPMRSIVQMRMPPRLPQQQQQRRPVVRQNAPVVPIQRPQQKQKKQKKQQQQRQAEVLPTAVLQSLPTDTPGVRESEIGQGVAPASPARRQAQSMASAAVLKLTPATLRQQFILTELLQPPLALRE